MKRVENLRCDGDDRGGEENAQQEVATSARATAVKVRIGIGLGGGSIDPAELVEIARTISAVGFDSIWVSEVLSGSSPDPLVTLAYLAAAVPNLKLGTTMLLPGRNPVRLAKALATLDRMCGGDLLVTVVPGLSEGVERHAVGVAPKDRGAVIDATLPLVRRLLAGEQVEYDGPGGHVEGITCAPLPIQQPFEFWLGGLVQAALERCGRFGDGWLPSLCTPEEARRGREVIDLAAASAGRAIDREHFGVSLSYSRSPLSTEAIDALARRARGHDPETLIPVGPDRLRRRIGEFIDAGVSKFVVRPLSWPPDRRAELEELADEIGNLQT
jgi:probable F420-dependent oxidoreductase